MKQWFIIAITVVTQTACATVVRGTEEPFIVSSEPTGAIVTTTLETRESKIARAKNSEIPPVYYGCAPTPCEFTIPRRSKFVARIDKEGFAAIQFAVRSKSSLGGQTTTSTLPGAVAVTTGVAAATATPGFLGFNSYLAGASATSATLATAPIVAIDAANGSMLSLYPNPVTVTLTPLAEVDDVNYDLDTLSDGNDTRDYGYMSRIKKAQKDSEPNE